MFIAYVVLLARPSLMLFGSAHGDLTRDAKVTEQPKAVSLPIVIMLVSAAPLPLGLAAVQEPSTRHFRRCGRRIGPLSAAGDRAVPGGLGVTPAWPAGPVMGSHISGDIR
ncbi:hypothetical protein OHR86_00455 [Streptomyces sp. NBC_00441]|uniref:hypothetical protein n=1 Tax=Streptomyces sp. NBC_00441 TaxID=2975742 RepID=UPI002E2B0D47|nr:hypothetical protein [Streptomyces sp. NBC_00441]